ncbi:multidrug resistance protein fnx1 [Xylariaceae sp. FL1651]|nr:multidrug resistance protein fnx1 [Xylariaceae sp. FL1651]
MSDGSPSPRGLEATDPESEKVSEQRQNDGPAEATSSVGGGAPPKDFRFWAIIFSLCVTGLLGALENTVVVTSLPTISEGLQLGRDYIWVTNVFFLTSAAVQPLFGQLADIFGRRWLTMFIVAVYTLGSGICGGATNGAMLIAGRAVQGIGSGGVNMIVDVIISDLVPLRERGNYISIILTVYAIGTSLGPFVGGILVDRSSWRWVFYINLPVGGAALVLLFLFLRVKSRKGMTFAEKVKSIDYIGNAILIASTVSTLYALTYGGSIYAWSDSRVITSLVFGLVGLILFVGYEGSKWPKEPVTPLRLFSHRTGAIIAFNTFMNSALLYWATFFLPVYFQAVLLSTATWSGVQLLPVVLVAVPGAIVAVIVLSKFGKYKALHLAGFAIETLSLGLFSTLDESSSTAEWVIFQVLAGLGSGMILNTLLPAFQAGLPERDQASATASWAFIRSFGNVWGVAIPAAIFANQFQKRSHIISDAAVTSQLEGAQAYEHATKAFLGQLQDPVRSETIQVYVYALKYVWYVAVVFSGLSFILAIFEKEIPLRKELDTEYGMEGANKRSGSAVEDASNMT